MAIFVSDTFTDTDATALDSHTGETGATWHDHNTGGNKMVVDANRIHGGASAGSLFYASGTPASADYTVEADFVFLSQATIVGITGRVVATNDTGQWNGYYLRHRAFFGWQLFVSSAGALTQLGTTIGPELSAGQTKRGKLEMIGTAIKAYVDGVEIISVTDATHSTAGKAGVAHNSGGGSSSVGVHLDNYAATDAGGGGGRASKNTRASGFGLETGINLWGDL
jgi:hypothetical protein